MTACVLSLPVDGLSWLDALAAERPDALVTPPMPGVPAGGVAGLWPWAEWRMGRDGGREELGRFAFGSPGPAMGYLSYHAGFGTLGVDLLRPDFPAGVFRKYRALLAPSPDARMVHIHARDPADARRAAALLRHPSAAPPLPAFPGPARPSLGRDGYMDAVHRALEHILDGDVYQLNLSIRFEADWPGGLTAPALFTSLMRSRPAMFYGLYDDPPYTLVSTSPERFLLARGGRVLSQPIKGTRAAGNDLDLAVRDILASPKEDAELSMIVDLIRNDISPHCRYGSVGVDGHKSLFLVDGLLQMYANVTGELREGSTVVDLLWDALPPGSVTGCPKRRAAEIIASLEPHHREAYCGCLALIHGPRDMDSSVAIRTAVRHGEADKLVFHAGSGIVVDSDAGLEYEETLAKAAKFLALARGVQP